MNTIKHIQRLFLLLCLFLAGVQTTKAQEAYANYTPSNTTLTFYYDNLRSTRTGTTYDVDTYVYWPEWMSDGTADNATKVVFNSSFANARPTKTDGWFAQMKALQTITGMKEYLNTSEVTTMSSMFHECSKLTELDLSHFNTGNVTDMSCMFYECSKLTNLDLSSFNTAKVTNMNSMFMYCRGLTSLDLSSFNTAKVTTMEQMFYECYNLTSVNLSSFNTANVTDMNHMFDSCKSLTALDLSSFNTANVTDMHTMFYLCKSLTSLNLSNFNTSNVTNMRNMFCGCSALTSLNVNNFNTGNVTNMFQMFRGCSGLTSLNVSSFNTSNVTDMGNMFADCSNLTSLNVSNFNTANMTDMSGMFNGCSGLTSLDLSSFNTANVTEMQYMFNGCQSLTSLDLSNFNTANVTNMSGMFWDCHFMPSLDLSSFNTANVTDMREMFYNCNYLKTIYASSAWSTASVTESDDMFYTCFSLVGGQGTTFDENHVDASYAHIDGGTGSPGYFTGRSNEPEAYACYTPSNKTLTFYYDKQRLSSPGTTYVLNEGTNYPGWKNDGSNASVTTVVFDPTFADVRPTSTYGWFYGMQNLQTITGISNLNTSEVRNMYAMFYNCSSLTSINLSGFNTASVTNMSNMFYNCSGLISLNVINFNTTKVTDMSNMFNKCSNLTSLNLSGFNTAKATNMSNMFYNCSGLTSLNLSSFNTANVETMNNMFANCRSLTNLDLSSFNTAKVTNMASMFYYCNSLRSIDLSNFNTANVTNMTSMFSDCSNLTALDLSSFNTSKVTMMNYMFSDCSNLSTIIVGNGWTTAAVSVGMDMFLGCRKLVGGQGTTYNANHVDKEYARVDGGYSNPGYLTGKDSPYAVLSADGKTLTFYADGKRLQHTEQTYTMNPSNNTPDWCTYPSTITTVVFDASMTSARPTTTYGWFASMDKLTTIRNIEYLNTSEVTEMNQMFYRCEKLTSLDLSHFNTSKVTDMELMFNECSSLTSLDLSSFNTSNVDYMGGMFYGCSSLVELNLSSFNTSNVTHMPEMFAECSSLVELNLSSFNTSKVTDMDWMFYNCSSLTTVIVSDGWDMTHVTRSEEMLYKCYNIMGELGTTYDSGYCGEDAAHVDLPGYPGYFVSADFLTVPYALLSSDKKTLTLYHDGQRGSRRMQKTYSINMADNEEPGWYQDESMWEITQVVIDPSFADVRPTSTYYWFGQMNVLTDITGMEYLNTSEVTNMVGMFEEDFVLTSLDVSHFNTRKVTNMAGMFEGCNELTALDVSGFDTRNVTNMYGMFGACNSLTAIDVRNFDTQKVTNMGSMFSGCNSLTNLDVSFLNTANVTDMKYMFGDCEHLTSLDLRNFNTAKVTDMMYMFSGCSNMRTIIVGDGWSTGNVTESRYMFTGCDKLVGGAGTVFDKNHVDAEYAHLDGGLDNPGYLSKYDVGLKVGGIDVNVKNMADVLGDGTVSFDPATLTLTLNNANIVTESGHAIETTADYSGTQLIIELLGQNYIDSGDDYQADILLNTNTFIKGPGELTLEDNSSSAIWINGSHSLFITYGCTIRARFISAPGFYTGSDTGNLIVTGADTRIILRAGDETEANIYGFSDVILDEDSGLEFTYPAGAWYDNEDEYCVMCDEGEAYGVTIECPTYYVVFDSSTSTLTFYGDGQRASHNATTEKVYFLNQGSTVPAWYSDNSSASVTKVVFHESFADVRPTSTYGWFTQMKNLTSITGIENLNTSEVTTMRSMFNNCSKLTSINLSHFNTAKVTSMRQMFLNCENLTSLDLSSFNTAKVTDMYNMFGGCSGLTSLDVSSFNTANVTDMGYMFSWCTSLTSLDLSGFDTKNVTNMGFMFYKSSGLTSIDLSSFNTAKVTAMDRMFSGCTSLTTVYAGENWSTAKVTESDYMFTNCTNIKGGMGTTHDPYHVTAEYAHVDGGASNPGYFTFKAAFLRGDVNRDDKVDVADITALTNHLLGTGGSFNEQAADVNLSGSVTTADTKIIVEYLLGKIDLESFTVEVKALHARMETAEEYYKMSKAELESKDSGHAQNALWEMASEIEAMITALQEQLESVSSEYDVEVCQASENELLERIEILNVAINELQ